MPYFTSHVESTCIRNLIWLLLLNNYPKPITILNYYVLLVYEYLQEFSNTQTHEFKQLIFYDVVTYTFMNPPLFEKQEQTISFSAGHSLTAPPPSRHTG